MRMNNSKNLGRKINTCIKACLKVGIELSVNDFGLDILNDHWVNECGWIHPLATLMLVDQPEVKYNVPMTNCIKEHLHNKYNKNSIWVSSICDGISGFKYLKYLDKRAWRMGKNIRKEYKLGENL